MHDHFFQTSRNIVLSILTSFVVVIGLVISSEDRHLDSHKFGNRSDRDDSYDYSHGSLRTAREERAAQQQQGYPHSDRGHSDRGRHSQYDYTSNNHRYSESEVSKS